MNIIRIIKNKKKLIDIIKSTNYLNTFHAHSMEQSVN